jgi:hypothetical protein
MKNQPQPVLRPTIKTVIGVLCRIRQTSPLEHFHKFCSQAGEARKEAIFLIFGFVSAQSQAAAGILLRQSLAKNPRSTWLQYFFKYSKLFFKDQFISLAAEFKQPIAPRAPFRKIFF